MHKRYSAIALCAVAAALAGCGSSGDSASNPNGIGHANLGVFRGELTQLCQQGNAAVAKVANNPAKTLKVIDRYLGQFKALSVQGPLETKYQAFLANIEAEIAALRTGNASAVKSLQAKNAVLAKQLGVPACAG